jgi:hypothetical protein
MEVDYGKCPEIFIQMYGKEYIETIDFLSRADAKIASLARKEFGPRKEGFFVMKPWSDTDYRREYLNRKDMDMEYAVQVSRVREFRREFENFLSIFEIELNQHGDIISINQDVVNSGMSVSIDSDFLKNHRFAKFFISEYLS